MAGSTAKKTYLSRLGPEEIQNLLRHLSARPLHPAWQSRLSPIDAFNILKSPNNPLKEPLRRLLVKAGICSETVLGKCPPGPELICPTDIDLGKRIFEILATGVGPTFERLGLDFASNDFRDIDLLLQHCTQLRALRITAKVQLGPFVKEASGRLRELVIKGHTLTRGSIGGIAEHCAGLTSLSVDFEHAQGSLDPIWDTVGPTLEKLALRVPFFRTEEKPPPPLAAVAEHCTKVTDLTLGGTVRHKATFLALCAALGGRLESLRFLGFEDAPDRPELIRGLDLLPNAKIDTPVVWDEREVIEAAGARLTGIQIEGKVFEGIDESAQLLTVLETAHVRVVEWAVCDFFRRMFAFPSDRLRSLWIESTQYEHEKSLFDVVADTVHTLEELRFNIHATFDGSYRRFAESNPQLRKVLIQYKLDGLPENVVLMMNAQAEAVQIVHDFQQCPKLEALEVSSKFLRREMADVREACRGIGRRGVDVFIGGEQYPSSLLCI